MASRQDKITSLAAAVALVKEGDCLAFGGNLLHRSPVGVAKAIARAGIKGLTLVKTVLALEADLLCGAGCVSRVIAGFVGYENEYGLCNFYRRAVERGEVKADEHACYTIQTGWRAAAQGVPFLPVRGMEGSDLVPLLDLKTVQDPYSGEALYAIQAIRPDLAFLHAQRVDRFGNAEIDGPVYDDGIIARSAKILVVTCEELVDDEYFGAARKATIPSLLVRHVVQLPGGAAPGSCTGFYEIDDQEMRKIKGLKSPEDLAGYLNEEEA